MDPIAVEVISKESQWLTKAILAFAQFVVDYKVKPLALELIMRSEKYKVASPVDMIFQMTIMEKGPWGEPLKSGPNKGEPKTIEREKVINAIMDFKSSQNGFFDKHFFQLHLYKRIVKENYPDLEIEGLYNWSPKDWRGAPTYNLKEQSDGKLEELCDVVFEQGRIKHEWKTPTVTTFADSISMSTYETEPMITTVPLKEYLENKHAVEKESKEDGSETTEETTIETSK